MPFRHDCSIDFINAAIFLVVALGRQPAWRHPDASRARWTQRRADCSLLARQRPSLVRTAIDVVVVMFDVVLKKRGRGLVIVSGMNILTNTLANIPDLGSTAAFCSRPALYLEEQAFKLLALDA